MNDKLQNPIELGKYYKYTTCHIKGILTEYLGIAEKVTKRNLILLKVIKIDDSIIDPILYRMIKPSNLSYDYLHNLNYLDREFIYTSPLTNIPITLRCKNQIGTCIISELGIKYELSTLHLIQ